jgi:hypothetical protein
MTSIFIHLMTRRRSVTSLWLVITIALRASAGSSAAVPIAAKEENKHERQRQGVDTDDRPNLSDQI